MEVPVEIEPNCSIEARSEDAAVSVGEKRPVEDVEDSDLGAPSPKKVRGERNLVGNAKKVAEIVLVLAAMGKMRGGKSPTAAEKTMMAEARGKLAEICEVFAPKDVFPRDAFGLVIEDLGLNKLKEHTLGFHPAKMTIAQKLSMTKHKMERSADFLHPGTYASQRLQTNPGQVAESRGASHAVRVFSSDKPSHAPIGGVIPTSSLGHVSAENLAPLPHQLPATEVKRSTLSNGLPSSHPGKDPSSLSLPRVERAQFRLDGRSNGSSYTSQGQANLSADKPQMKTPTWSLQPSSTSSAKFGQDNKVPDHSFVKFEGNAHLSASHVGPQATTSKQYIAQPTSANQPNIHQHLQGVNLVQAPPLHNNHIEIGKIILRFFQKQHLEHPSWIPPSRDYMNKAVTCQTCKGTINEVENVLVCDACEKGYHIKCLQSYNQKGIPKGEWHCAKCLMLSNGKPLPPKYGRVMRNINAPKVPSTTQAGHSALNKKVGSLDEKVSQQKVTVKGNSGLRSASSVTIGNNHDHLASNSSMPNARVTESNEISPIKGQMDDKTCSGTSQNIAMETLESAHVTPAASVGESAVKVNPVSENKGALTAKLSGTVVNKLNQSQAFNNHQESDQTGITNHAETPSMTHDVNNLTVDDVELPNEGEAFECYSDSKTKQDEQRFAQTNLVEGSGTVNQTRENCRSLSDGLHSVDWIGDVLQVADEKTYYQSCCISGVVYKLQDHIVVHYDNKLMPSKLQAMWEDSKTSSKWIAVSRCYFPGDLPEVVGRPCAPEMNEVYESNHVVTMMAGLVQGRCEVFSPTKFVEENGRSVQSGTVANDGLRPVFLCKWFFDEIKGVFRDVSSSCS